MNIAFVEWWPRICGTTDWATHIASGAAELGHNAHLITFSKSGRRLAAWGSKGDAWTVYSVKDAPTVLGSYDLVVLADIICQAPEVDGAAIKKGELPYWLGVLEQSKTPWTTMIHGGYYRKKSNPIIEAALAMPNFTGTLLCTRRAGVERINPHRGNINWVLDPYLPYNFHAGVAVGRIRTRDAMMTARVSSTKGQMAAALLWANQRMPQYGNLHLWGYTGYGKPAFAWRLYELLVSLGYETVRFPVKDPAHPNTTHPEAHKFFTGEYEAAFGSRHLLYHWEYGSPADVDWSPWLHLSLTNPSLGGTLEYITLDAIDNRCVAIVPEHQAAEAEYSTLVTIPYRQVGVNVKRGEPVEVRTRDWDEDSIVGTLSYLMANAPEEELTRLAENQRVEIRGLHQPSRVLTGLLRAL